MSGNKNSYQDIKVLGQDINILLLGETGVGKSTFINAIANYLDYETFEKAEKQETTSCLIPTKFTVTDESFNEKIVSIGQDVNENTSISSSATQTTRSYVFELEKYKKRRLRLIDTPGIGDTRGIQSDAENLENILAYIGQMEYLHAICFLLKPNNSRLTVMFEYCIKQLLSRLEKSASRNIIFIFTNSRSTFYKPGDTTSAIKKILDSIRNNPPNVDIAFGKDNVFCLDNESFRYLVAINNNISLGNKQSFAESWVHSAQECHRMIQYVIGEGTLKMAPHRVKNTMSVNEARRIILQLSRPLAEIADHINDNINVLQRHTKSLNQDNTSVEALKSKLYVPVVNLRHKELSQPTTVCTNVNCSEIYMVGDRKKYHYKQRCHDPCYLTNVPKEMIGDPALKGCAAMGAGGKCKQCSCDFSAHMHIYYITETYEDKIHNTGVKDQITDREGAIKNTRALIGQIEQRVKSYEGEKAVIVKSMAKFAHFLQHNAIAPYNDAYKAYIEYLINRENSLGPNCDAAMLKSLEDLLKQYEQERDILEQAFKMSSSDGASIDRRITADSIFRTVKELFSLQFTGKDIKEMQAKHKKNELNEFKDTEVVLQRKALPQLISDTDDDDHSEGKAAPPQNWRTRGRGRGRGHQQNNNSRGHQNNNNNNRGKFKPNHASGKTMNSNTNHTQRNNWQRPQQFPNQFETNFQRGSAGNVDFFNLPEQPKNRHGGNLHLNPDDELMQHLQEFQRQKMQQQHQNWQQNSFENRSKSYKESNNFFADVYNQPRGEYNQTSRNNSFENRGRKGPNDFFSGCPNQPNQTSRNSAFDNHGRTEPNNFFVGPSNQPRGEYNQMNRNNSFEDHGKQQYNPFDQRPMEQNVPPHFEKQSYDREKMLLDMLTRQQATIEDMIPKSKPNPPDNYSRKTNDERLISELLAKYGGDKPQQQQTREDFIEKQFAEMSMDSGKSTDGYYKKNTNQEDPVDTNVEFQKFLQSNGLDDLCKQGKYYKNYYDDDSDSDNESKKRGGFFKSWKNLF